MEASISSEFIRTSSFSIFLREKKGRDIMILHTQPCCLSKGCIIGLRIQAILWGLLNWAKGNRCQNITLSHLSSTLDHEFFEQLLILDLCSTCHALYTSIVKSIMGAKDVVRWRMQHGQVSYRSAAWSRKGERQAESTDGTEADRARNRHQTRWSMKMSPCA